MKMSKEIRKYIWEHDIDTDALSITTGVNVGQLYLDADKPFNASEMLSVCAFLHIEPEAIWAKVQDTKT